MRVCDERLGVTRDGPPGGPAPGGRGYQLTQHPPFSIRVTFYRREGDNIAALRVAIPPTLIARTDARIEMRRVCSLPDNRHVFLPLSASAAWRTRMVASAKASRLIAGGRAGTAVAAMHLPLSAS
jgi:hypothetical protein